MMAIKTSIWMYWLCCAIAMLLVIRYQAFWKMTLVSERSMTADKGQNYTTAIGLGWLATMLAAVGYVSLTHKYETGSYALPDLLMFSVSNGVLEQFMFVFWLLVGCYLGKLYAPNRPSIVFGLGFTVYAIFSGLIHAFFWITVLPSHEPVVLFMAFLLTSMSFIWMWLFWRYQALFAIIAMHIFIDFFMLGHLHFTWFEPLQAFLQTAGSNL